jgi:hypothetical protein
MMWSTYNNNYGKSQKIIAKMKLGMAGGAAVLSALELAASRRSKASPQSLKLMGGVSKIAVN